MKGLALWVRRSHGAAGRRQVCRHADFTVLFCGRDFPHALDATRRARPSWNLLACERAGLAEALQSHVQVLVPLMTSLDGELVARARHAGVKLIHQFGAGLEGVDQEAAKQQGIAVRNIPAGQSGNAISSAEHAIYLLLSTMRNPTAMQAVLSERLLGSPVGNTIHAKKALVVGFGGLGREIARRLTSLGAEVRGFRCGEWPAEDRALVQQGGSFDESGRAGLVEMARGCELLVVCCPLNAKTVNLIDRYVLLALRPGAFVVNVARGGIVNRRDLLELVQAKRLGGVGLDVFWKGVLTRRGEVVPADSPDRAFGRGGGSERAERAAAAPS
eukprot:763740-Hanusia_phi.AAC.2